MIGEDGYITQPLSAKHLLVRSKTGRFDHCSQCGVSTNWPCDVIKAVAADRARIAEAVRALPAWRAKEGWTFGNASVVRAAVLVIVDDLAKP